MRVHPLPWSREGPQSSSLPQGAQALWTNQEPASTGTRSREFGKQISDERIERCLSGGVSQEATSREVPSPKEAVPPLVILTTGFGGETAKTVRRSSAPKPFRFSREGRTRGHSCSRGSRLVGTSRITVSGVSGITPFDPKPFGGHGDPRPSGERGARPARSDRG